MSFCKTCLNAAPKPSHTGRWNRVCVQAKIQGIARSDSMPPLGFRFDGLLPIFILPYSNSEYLQGGNIQQIVPLGRQWTGILL
ncbi:Os01g0758350 [Oryza sativa Japonica Group]|uniref:Os01g0758350 protein n=1 Tax=Oryza sativa subsp. japonica TaxID=39947 RepID=A0A0P0V8H8_ORYSJ|nr:hypothetical protein EE612_005838 [Oryza sativa]BAS74428.1 Os01g0758350 [Oryza sativa Japonica Group]